MNQERAELEERAGIEPIERLQHKRRGIVEELAPLQARVGSLEAKRKAYRNVIACELAGLQAASVLPKPDPALEIVSPGGKRKIAGERLTYSEAALERMACADPRYRRLLRAWDGMSARVSVLQTLAAECTELINRDQVLVRYLASEPH